MNKSFADEFEPGDRNRGRGYSERGRVRLEQATPRQAVARVQGSYPYEVELHRNGVFLDASCSCEEPEAGRCWHVWAVIHQLTFACPALLTGVHAVNRVPAPEIAAEAGEEKTAGSLAQAADTSRADGSAAPNPVPRDWRKQLKKLASQDVYEEMMAGEGWSAARQLLYVAGLYDGNRDLHVEVLMRDRKEGGWSKSKPISFVRDLIELLPEDSDRRILTLLGATDGSHLPGGEGLCDVSQEYHLNARLGRWLLPEICASGRCYLRRRAGDEEPDWLHVRWDAGGPWMLQLTMASAPEGHYRLTGAFVRDGVQLPVSSIVLIAPSVLFTRSGEAMRYEPAGARYWLEWLSQQRVKVPREEGEEFLTALLRRPGLPPLVVPPELQYEEIVVQPLPRLTVRPGDTAEDPLRGEPCFLYQDQAADPLDAVRILQAGERRVLRRDLPFERAAVAALHQVGWRRVQTESGASSLELAPRHLPRVVRELTAQGWEVEAPDRRYRPPGRIRLQVSSGTDWFELQGEADFGPTKVSLPALLKALRAGDRMVLLDDGSYGMLPEEWLRRYGLLADLGEHHRDHLRFSRNQAALLDALLATHPQASCDAVFERARKALSRFKGVQGIAAPEGFQGELRPYQEEGLGWMHFLQQFGFGGCLADDMGLGKTVQVLALLESRRELRTQRRSAALADVPGPSLIVMPKSLIFNWKQEAARFTPELKVLDHTGAQRQKGTEHVTDYDVVLTTYGTLRKDVVEFKDLRFDYVILDEAQAIKNASSASAKAVRLLSCDHRLAVSGTPVENHLGELWSLFEFLNPGMLGSAAVFNKARGDEPGMRQLLAQALRPYLLRRTKEQVIQDLPPKIEQTLYCDLEKDQRREYDDLREHYRKSLLERAVTDGLPGLNMQVLEALLRLRQAAIHPGLIDESRWGDASAKLDVLLPRLKEVSEEGHKTLVFSQFTGMLSILRRHLDAEKIPYEYLDGKTADREACVRRFQEDPECRVFLISLKAGGVGLNLTAAQYVFLLDPWWNPAVEAQAIDRAHRFGQHAQVFAYRLIARDTVEEKVLALQDTKRALADQILGNDNSLIGKLAVEDLQLLLS